jgi:hypothetical protein
MIDPRSASGQLVALATAALIGCVGSPEDPSDLTVSVAVTPAYAIIPPEAQQAFSAAVTGSIDSSVTWAVQEGAPGGLVNASGLYTAPSTVGTFHVVATSNADRAKSASATVYVGDGPSAPSGPHPRLFMSASELATFRSDAQTAGSPAARLVARCQSAISRGGPVGSRTALDDYWPGDAAACAFAYQLDPTNTAAKTHAILNWRAALDNVYTLGASDGCTVANLALPECVPSTSRPACTEPVKGDTGYGMRWYGPFLALTYDWLHNAVSGTADDGLLAQTRGCLTVWMDNYDIHGYQRNSPGSNYHAGYMVGKVLSSIAIGTDSGSDGHLWAEVQTLFSTNMVADGLAAGPAPGFLVGGDWGSWQYGPNALAAYATATRAVESHGLPQPEMRRWLDSTVLRALHGLTPSRDGQWVGNGDYSGSGVYQPMTSVQLDAALLGPSSDRMAGWAAHLRSLLGLSGGSNIYGPLGAARKVPAVDYVSTDPPRWYVSEGTGTVYARSAWTTAAFWGVFVSSRQDQSRELPDHRHFAASNFAFSRGADHLIVDVSSYGYPSTMSTNAVSVDSANGMGGGYLQTQTPWGVGRLPWRRTTTQNVFAARADITDAFDSNTGTQGLDWGRRDWTMFPEGEIVVVDRVNTGSASRGMYVQLHAGSPTMTWDAGTATATSTVGASKVVIHLVKDGGATPTVRNLPASAPCSGSFPYGPCETVRRAAGKYLLYPMGPWASTIHVIDGLASAEAPAAVGSLNDDTNDPAPKYNGGVIGASVLRSGQRSYVVATSATNGATGTTMTYRTPGASPARHVVYDAPEAGDGTSSVGASVSSGHCVLTITAGSGGGVKGRPLIFDVGAASSGCAVTGQADAPPAAP